MAESLRTSPAAILKGSRIESLDVLVVERLVGGITRFYHNAPHNSISWDKTLSYHCLREWTLNQLLEPGKLILKILQDVSQINSRGSNHNTTINLASYLTEEGLLLIIRGA
jgi:hypothetical protein